MIRKILFIVVISLLVNSCKENKINYESKFELPDMVYPKYRQWSSPVNGEIVLYNSPSFQWPKSGKKNIYDIKISKDSEFKKNLIEKNNIPYSFYNPHKKLENGKWFWKYRTAGSAWSKTQFFFVNEKTIDFVSPKLDLIINNISNEHPRVWIEKSNWDEFIINSKNRNESKIILKKADQIIGKRIPKESDAITNKKGRSEKETNKIEKNASQQLGFEMGYSLEALIRAYVLTKDIKYYIEAKKWMMEASSWDPNGITRRNDFGDALIMSSLAMGYDVFYEILDEKEKIIILNHTKTRANNFYTNWKNYLEDRNSSMHVWQHIIHRLFKTSIALIKDVPDAEKWLDYIYNLWITQHPKMGEQDGAWFNGTGYVRMNVMTMLDIPLKLNAYSNFDFFEVPFYKNFMKWLSYSFPPGSSQDGFCNDGYKYPTPNNEYLGFSDAISRILNDPYAKLYKKRIQGHYKTLDGPIIDLNYRRPTIPKKIFEEEEYGWFRLRYGYKMKISDLDSDFKLPDAEIFPQVGVAYLNSDINNISQNLMLSIKSSPFGAQLAHTHAEHNTFNIAYKGKRIFYNTGYRPWQGAPHSVGWYNHTQGHNGILINGEGQPYDSGSYGFLPRFIRGNQLSYVLGDGSHAYESHESKKIDLGVSKFKRHYILLKPNIIVIYDDLEADNPSHWTWLIHNYDGMKIGKDKNSLTTLNNDLNGKLNLYGSQEISFNITDKFSVDPVNILKTVDANGNIDNFKNHWHFKSKNIEKTKKMRFLSIIQVSDKNFYLPIENDIKDEYKIGDWKISINLDTNFESKLIIKNDVSNLEFISSLDESDELQSNETLGMTRLIEIVNNKPLKKYSLDNIPYSIKKLIKTSKNEK